VTKQAFRNLMFEKRKQALPNDIKRMNDDLIQQILKDHTFQDAKSVAIFYPMQGEVNLLELIKLPKRFSFPKIVDQLMHFYEYNEQTQFVKSKFGVLEPEDGTITDESIDYMLVPALVISKDLYRIGYGKGFYDHFLSNYRPKTVIGVIYEFQETDHIPNETHDQQLDGFFKGKL
jgi:5-formyltetrahydrofolate cyclo-ligase